jgi:hypothetical protein
MNTQHLMSLPADAPQWAWSEVYEVPGQDTGIELNGTPSPRRPAAAVANIGDQAWLVVTFDVQGNAEVLGLTAVRPGLTPDLPMVIAALDDLDLLR